MVINKKYIFKPFGYNRIKIIKKMIIDCSPQEKIIADLGSGKDTFINSIDCKNLITLDINPLNSPDIICDFNKGIPLGDNTVDIVVAGEVLEHLYFSKKFRNFNFKCT